jgi:hypothetical protein
MSLVSIAIWSSLGIAVGFGIAIFGASSSAAIRDTMLKQIFKSNKDGWALVQRGNSYELEPLTRDEDADAYRIGPEDEAEWVEDEAGLMHSIYRVPFGLKLESRRPMVDVETAAAAEGARGKITDGGQLDGSETFSLDQLRDKLHVGRLNAGSRTYVFVNPFVERATEAVYDLRSIGRVMTHDASPDTPRKTAKNAKEAERAFDGLGGIKEKGMYLACFVAGGIVAYIGGSGGGGGGGGVNVPVTVVDVMTSGVF